MKCSIRSRPATAGGSSRIRATAPWSKSQARSTRCNVRWKIQQALGERNANLLEEERFELRVGISLGDVIVEGDDLYGNGVNVAARMDTLAETGGICVSGNVHEHTAGSLDLEFEELGGQVVKNIARPVPAFRLNHQGRGPSDGRWGVSERRDGSGPA